jgi:hypothetical protein
MKRNGLHETPLAVSCSYQAALNAAAGLYAA